MGQEKPKRRTRTCWEVALARQATARRRAAKEPSFWRSLEGNLLMSLLITGAVSAMQNLRFGAPATVGSETLAPEPADERRAESRAIVNGVLREMRRQKREDQSPAYEPPMVTADPQPAPPAPSGPKFGR